MKDPKKVKQGKRNRAAGKRFELLVRADLEKSGWVVCKWMNNVEGPFEIDIGEYDMRLASCKPKFNPFTKSLMMMSGGFPDFIAFKLSEVSSAFMGEGRYVIHGIECKSGKYLDADEKNKCRWLVNNKIFTQLLIARKGKKRGEILYEEFI